jgi:hypothetical protein
MVDEKRIVWFERVENSLIFGKMILGELWLLQIVFFFILLILGDSWNLTICDCMRNQKSSMMALFLIFHSERRTSGVHGLNMCLHMHGGQRTLCGDIVMFVHGSVPNGVADVLAAFDVGMFMHANILFFSNFLRA